MRKPDNLLSDEERAQLQELTAKFLGFFRMEVLSQYRVNSHKYDVETTDFEGCVETAGSVADDYYKRGESVPEPIHIRFGYRRLKDGEWALAVLWHDFKQSSEAHVQRWLPYLVDSADLEALPDFRFEMWAARNILGSWEVENNVIERIEEQVRMLNATTCEVFGRQLYEWPSNEHLGTPIAENDLAYQDAHRELYGLLIDGLNEDAVNSLLQHSGCASSGNAKKTRQRLETALPGMAGSILWSTLDKVSEQRRLAAHKVRPPAKAFRAFESFIDDLSAIHVGLVELVAEFSRVLGVDPRVAMLRQEARSRLQRIDQPMQNEHGMSGLLKCLGRTIERIEYGLRENRDANHRSDVVLIHFMDGSVVGLDTGSNAGNVALDHVGVTQSEFDVYFISHFVPPLQRPSPNSSIDSSTA